MFFFNWTFVQITSSILWNAFMNWALNELFQNPWYSFVLSYSPVPLNKCKRSASKIFLHLCNTHTHTLTQWHRGAHDQKKWELSVESWQCPDLAQCREILILRGCSLWPALFSWSGILLIVQVTETEAAGLKRTSVGGNNGLSQPINVSCSASAHWLFASPPSRVLSDQPLSLTA